MRWPHVLGWPLLPRWTGSSNGLAPRLPRKRPSSQVSPRAHGPRGILFFEHFAILIASVDDLDHPAGARLHDHSAVIDDRVAIFGVARHGPQLDGRRKRLADDDALTHHDGALAPRDRSDHRVRDFQPEANGRTNGAA